MLFRSNSLWIDKRLWMWNADGICRCNVWSNCAWFITTRKNLFPHKLCLQAMRRYTYSSHPRVCKKRSRGRESYRFRNYYVWLHDFLLLEPSALGSHWKQSNMHKRKKFVGLHKLAYDSCRDSLASDSHVNRNSYLSLLSALHYLEHQVIPIIFTWRIEKEICSYRWHD